MGRSETTSARLYSIGLPFASGHAACAQVPVTWKGIRVVDQRFVSAMKKRGLQTHVWTINEPAQMHHLLGLGVDGLMTDRPAILKAVLMERGQWNQAS
jgi:glycerophosphoryl diester phosphodiesterase